jgi:hypothetical protein
MASTGQLNTIDGAMQEPRCARPCINVACQVPGTAFCDLYLYLRVRGTPAPLADVQIQLPEFLSHQGRAAAAEHVKCG